jgi:hypothetical protein
MNLPDETDSDTPRPKWNPCGLLGHRWRGCKCKRCGITRDRGHDWEVRDCTPVCRRCFVRQDPIHSWQGCRCKKCGQVRDEQHEWEVCSCKGCGQTRHEWQAGACTRCRKQCCHPLKTFVWKIVEAGQTAHAAKLSVCTICNSQVAVMYRSTPRPLAPQSDANGPGTVLPSASDLATDPLWRELWDCWLDLSSDDVDRSIGFWELGNWLVSPGRAGPRPAVLLCHEQTLKALVSLGQLDAAVAAGIQRAFDEAIYHIKAGCSTCYTALPPAYRWRSNLLEQTRALREMAQRGLLDPAVMTRARACIAQDIETLGSGEFHGWKVEAFATTCDTTQAARVLVEVLSRRP